MSNQKRTGRVVQTFAKIRRELSGDRAGYCLCAATNKNNILGTNKGYFTIREKLSVAKEKLFVQQLPQSRAASDEFMANDRRLRRKGVRRCGGLWHLWSRSRWIWCSATTWMWMNLWSASERAKPTVYNYFYTGQRWRRSVPKLRS